MSPPKTSRYKRTSERGNFNGDDVSRAIKSVMLENESVRAAAGRYNVPRSTLTRYIEKVSNNYSDLSTVSDENLQETIQQIDSYAACAVKQVFSVEQERALVSYVKKCSEHYYGLNITVLRQLAYQFAKKIQVQYPSKWNEDKMSGRDWYYGFMRRHQELALRTPEQTTLHRVKYFCKENVQMFFRNLGAVLSEYPYQAADIWNMDEMGFSTVPTMFGKVISTRGTGQISAQERGSMVTMALAISAEGNFIPPFFLFVRKDMQSTFLENASPVAIGFTNGFGWMQQMEFLQYVKFFIERAKASKQSPKILLLDNYSSHFSVEALDFAVENGVTIVSFPPHCSHRLQPLDVSIYGPVKAYYKSQCSAWQKNHAGEILEIRHIPGLVRSTLDLALSPRNVKAGFLVTGICPYNPDIFADSDFIQAVRSGKNERAVLETEVSEEDSQPRITVLDTPRVGTHEEVASSSRSSTSSSHESTLATILSVVEPPQEAAPAVKSNRARRLMKRTVLTSPESREELASSRRVRIN